MGSQTEQYQLHIISLKKSYLDDVGGAVEGGGHDAVEVVPDLRPVRKLNLVRDDGPPQTGARETRVLGEGVHLPRKRRS